MKKFCERKWIHEYASDSAYRKVNWFIVLFAVQNKFQQRTCSNYIQFRLIFVKITKGSNGARTFLDFIDKQQGIRAYSLRKM